MTEAHTPERIRVAQDSEGFWTCREAVSGSQEYVRADIVEDMLAALSALLPEIDSEIEQRQTSGNDEYWQGLKALSDAGHAAVAKAEGR